MVNRIAGRYSIFRNNSCPVRLPGVVHKKPAVRWILRMKCQTQQALLPAEQHAACDVQENRALSSEGLDLAFSKISSRARFALSIGCRLNWHNGAAPTGCRETDQGSSYRIAATISHGNFQWLGERLPSIARLTVAPRLGQRQTGRLTLHRCEARGERGVGRLIWKRLSECKDCGSR